MFQKQKINLIKHYGCKHLDCFKMIYLEERGETTMGYKDMVKSLTSMKSSVESLFSRFKVLIKGIFRASHVVLVLKNLPTNAGNA